MTDIDHLPGSSHEVNVPQPSTFDLKGEAYPFNPDSTTPLEVLKGGSTTLSKLVRLELAPDPKTKAIAVEDPSSLHMSVWSAVRGDEVKFFVAPEGIDFTRPDVQSSMMNLQPDQEVVIGRNDETAAKVNTIPGSVSKSHVTLSLDRAGNVVIQDTSRNGTRVEIAKTPEDKQEREADHTEVRRGIGGVAMGIIQEEPSLSGRSEQTEPGAVNAVGSENPELKSNVERDFGKITQLAQELEVEANRAETILSQADEGELLNRSANSSLEALERAKLLWTGMDALPEQERERIEERLSTAEESLLYAVSEYQYRKFIQTLRDVAADLYTAAQTIR
jgi:hypothetical protein